MHRFNRTYQENQVVMRYSDLFYQKNKNEVLKIKISNEDRYLIKKETPIGVIWRGDNESSVFYAFLANLELGIIQSDELKIMHSKLYDKIKKTDSLKLTISPLLNIVESGWYQIFTKTKTQYHTILNKTMILSQKSLLYGLMILLFRLKI